jgi:hypothetical protein
MASTLLTINMVTREAVRLWKNSNAFLQNVDMQYDDSFAVSGAKIGSTLRIRLPNDFTVTTGPALSVQDTSEQSTTLVLATQKHVDVGYSTADRTLSLDDYSRRVLAPMVNNLAGAVAVDIMSGAEGGICNFSANQDVANNILSPIAGTYLDAGASLDLNSAPIANRKIVNGPRTEARVVSALSGLLNPNSDVRCSGLHLDERPDRAYSHQRCPGSGFRHGQWCESDRVEHHSQCHRGEPEHW